MAISSRGEGGVGGGARGMSGGGSGKSAKPKLPKKTREARESMQTLSNRNSKAIPKDKDLKEQADTVRVKNKSGGTKPYSKMTMIPSGPKVPVKKKGK